MEMNADANATDYRSPAMPVRHHVRNLWPSVGGGLPGGKPVEPASAAQTPSLVPPDHSYHAAAAYGQSSATGYARHKPVPGPPTTGAAAADANSYYYKSSQARSDAVTPATANVVAPPPAGYGHYGVQPPPARYFQRPAAVPVAAPQHYAPRFYHHPDPTAMFNQVSGGGGGPRFSHVPARCVDVFFVFLSCPQGMSQYQLPKWDLYGPTPYFPSVVVSEPAPKAAPPMIGQVTDFVENEECFKVRTHTAPVRDACIPVLFDGVVRTEIS